MRIFFAKTRGDTELVALLSKELNAPAPTRDAPIQSKQPEGMIVWARLWSSVGAQPRPFPYWPARIVVPLPTTPADSSHVVFIRGGSSKAAEERADVRDDQILPFVDGTECAIEGCSGTKVSTGQDATARHGWAFPLLRRGRRLVSEY